MSWLSWIILGLVAGFIGGRIVNNSGSGFFLNVILGIVGAVVGGRLFEAFGGRPVSGLDIYSMIVAVVGSVIVLIVYYAVMGRKN